jgi:hypothetical protein
MLLDKPKPRGWIDVAAPFVIVSKPITPHQPRTVLPPTAQVQFFAELYHPALDATTFARIRARVRDLGLHFDDAELRLLAALDHPDKVQTFLNTHIYYNDDHAAVELEETAMPPRRVLQTACAHCFEGALFAYAVNFLHGYQPRWVLLEASQDSEHNLVVWREARTGLYGCNAHSAYPHLDGRPAEYATLRALVESYAPYYFTDYTRNPADLSLVGYSQPIDLVAKFGIAWMASDAPQWDIYYTYIDDTTRFHYLHDDSNATHLYPLIRALKEKWIELDAHGKPFVNPSRLPRDAQTLWRAFWDAHGEWEPYHRPHGVAAEIEKQFFHLTGTTPIDLMDNAFDLQFFLAAGYRIEQLMNRDRR